VNDTTIATIAFVVLALAVVIAGFYGMRSALRRGSFIQRGLAFAIDMTVVAALIYFASFQFTDVMVAAGKAGRAIGIGFLGVYLAVFCSALGGGRTIGLAITGLRIANVHGEAISFAQSFCRAGVLLLPFWAAAFSVQRHFQGDALQIATVVWSFVVVGIGGALLSLLWIGDGSQSLHDVVTGSYVVRAKDGVEAKRIGPWAIAGVLAIFALSLIAPMAPIAWLEGWDPGRTVALGLRMQRAFAGAGAFEMKGFHAATMNSLSSLEVEVWLYEPTSDLTSVCKRVADQALALAPTLLGYQQFSVSVGHGWDFGVASAEQGQTCYGTPAQWRQGNVATARYRLVVAGVVSVSDQQ
jgi:uncharacterized RDD family membrane protein YckC